MDQAALNGIIEKVRQTKSNQNKQKSVNLMSKVLVDNCDDGDGPSKEIPNDEMTLELQKHDSVETIIPLKPSESNEIYNSVMDVRSRRSKRTNRTSYFIKSVRSIPSSSSDSFRHFRSVSSPHANRLKTSRKSAEHIPTAYESTSPNRRVYMDRILLTKITTLQQNIQAIVGEIL